jgi:hypothetical protein
LQVPPPSSPSTQPRLFFRPCSFLCSSRPSRRVAVIVAVPAAAVAATPTCTCARSNAHQRACAPPHASPLGERQGRAFGPVDPCTEAVDLLATPPRILPCGCISARAQGKGEAFRVPREIPLSSARAPLDAAGRGCLFPSATVNANPSSAMDESPCATGLRGKSPDLWNVLASLVSHA